jgi:hypothetical protein
MSVILKAIKFNHDSNALTHDAITIRRNKTETISVPEWIDGASVNAEDSLAAYAMQETSGQTITIQARFHLVNERASSFEIRAIDANKAPRDQGGCIGWLIKLIYAIIQAFFGNVLGDVKTRVTNFSNNDSGFVSFDLLNPKIWTKGVGVYFTEWQWQYRRTRKQKWTNMQMSRHKIYVILEAPKSSWNQTANSDQLPWTEVLDYSCNWARFAKTRDEAATKITESVYGLGPATFEYDCPGGGSSHYASWTTFNCTKFLEKLKGLFGNGKYINCTDCATIVTTFSNVLGCDLWSSRMQSSFKLNPLLAIGSNTWQTACGWSGFSYHEVAWKNNCDANDEIFDACLQVDADANPTGPPHSGMLPVNIKFGDCNTMDYRLRLSPGVAGGCTNCNPAPATRIRRTVL